MNGGPAQAPGQALGTKLLGGGAGTGAEAFQIRRGQGFLDDAGKGVGVRRIHEPAVLVRANQVVGAAREP